MAIFGGNKFSNASAAACERVCACVCVYTILKLIIIIVPLTLDRSRCERIERFAFVINTMQNDEKEIGFPWCWLIAAVYTCVCVWSGPSTYVYICMKYVYRHFFCFFFWKYCKAIINWIITSLNVWRLARWASFFIHILCSLSIPMDRISTRVTARAAFAFSFYRSLNELVCFPLRFVSNRFIIIY